MRTWRVALWRAGARRGFLPPGLGTSLALIDSIGLSAARHRQTVSSEADQLVPCRRIGALPKYPAPKRDFLRVAVPSGHSIPAPSRIRAARASYPQATTTALETRSSAGEADEPCRTPGRLPGRPSPREPNRGPASTSSQPCRWGARPRAAIPTSSRPSTALKPLRIPHGGKTGALARRRNAARVPRARPRRVDLPVKKAPPSFAFLPHFLSRAVNSG